MHLIHPLGFRTSESAYKRAGLDYWEHLTVREHATWDEFCSATGASACNLWIIEEGAPKLVWEATFQRGDFLVFGSETHGVPSEILRHHHARMVMLPMRPNQRSLNLSNVVCATVFEGLRQLVMRGDCAIGDAGHLLDLQPRPPTA